MRGVSAIGAVGGGWCWESGLAAGGWVPGGVALGDWGIEGLGLRRSGGIGLSL